MEELINTGNRTMYLVLLLSAVPVAVATLVGLAIGLFQTVTQLQEQTLPYGAKLLSVCLSILLLMSWFGARMLDFAHYTLQLALSS
jgi:type III secretion HrpO family protein